MTELIPADQIPSKLAEVPQWLHEGKEIRRTFAFKDFAEALAFVNRAAELAEQANHHPDIDIRWNKVTLALSTHSKGGLTGADFALAAKVDAMFSD